MAEAGIQCRAAAAQAISTPMEVDLTWPVISLALTTGHRDRLVFGP